MIFVGRITAKTTLTSMAKKASTSITPDNLGELVRQIRTEKEVTQGDLAAKVGISRHQMIRLESGDAPSISFETLHSIFKTLGKDIYVK